MDPLQSGLSNKLTPDRVRRLRGIAQENVTYLEKGTPKTEKNTFKYEGDDEKGNWIKRTKYNDKGKAVEVVKRSITYYN